MLNLLSNKLFKQVAVVTIAAVIGAVVGSLITQNWSGDSDKSTSLTATVDVFGASTGFSPVDEKPVHEKTSQNARSKTVAEGLESKIVSVESLLWSKTAEDLLGPDLYTKRGVSYSNMKDVLVEGDIIYVALEDGVAAVRTSDGSVIWSKIDSDNNVKGSDSSKALAMLGDDLYISSAGSDSDPYVGILDASTGTLISTLKSCMAPGEAPSTRVIVYKLIDNRYIAVQGTHRASVYAMEVSRFSPDGLGECLWRFDISNGSPIKTLHRLPGGPVFIITTENGTIHLIRLEL